MPAAKKKKFDANKAEVIHIRTALHDKSLIEKAANSLGLTISSFMLQNAIRAARRELSEVERTTLSRKGAEAFFAAMTSPPVANAALKGAFRDYAKQSRK